MWGLMGQLGDPAFGQVVGTVGVVIGVLSLVVSYVFYRKSLRLKEPCWWITNTFLVRDYSATLPDLEVRYGKEAIKNLTISRIMFWNKGRDTIERSDIAPSDPVRVAVFGDATVLSSGMIASNYEANQCKIALSPDRRAVNIEFDFLDDGNGVVMEVIHTGTSASSIGVTGTVKGVGTPVRRRVGQGRTTSSLVQGWSFLGIVVALMMVGTGRELLVRGSADLVLVVLTLVAVIMLIVGVVTEIIVIRATRPPEGLEVILRP